MNLVILYLLSIRKRRIKPLGSLWFLSCLCNFASIIYTESEKKSRGVAFDVLNVNIYYDFTSLCIYYRDEK